MPDFFKDVVLGFSPALKSMWEVQIGLYGFKEENMKLGGWGRRGMGGSGMSWGGVNAVKMHSVKFSKS